MQYQRFIRIFIVFGIGIFFVHTFLFHFWSLSSSFITTNNCLQSLFESENFICESDNLWNERKILYEIQDKLNMDKLPNSKYFFTNWEPNFHCSHAQRVGKMGAGGKWVCDLFRLKSRSDCLIYSTGSGGEFSFEIQMKQFLPNCEIHTFDMSLYKCPNDVCIFHQIILGNGIFPQGSKTWQMIIEELGHKNRLIDLFQINIEGFVYNFIPSIFKLSNNSFPRQILVEMHSNNIPSTREFLELLRRNNYVIFNKEPNLVMGPEYFDFTFLKLNSQFFQ